MERILFNDGVIKAHDVHGAWVNIVWMTPGRSKFRALKNVVAIEGEIKRKGYQGWLMGSERDHTTMHKIIAKMGATRYAEDGHSIYFKKGVR